MASLFIGFLIESKSEIRFRMASFSFSSCLMRKRVAKSEAILALLDIDWDNFGKKPLIKLLSANSRKSW